MPSLPMSLCPRHGPTRGRCRVCERERQAARMSAAARGYDGRWRKERGAFLLAYPLCACGEAATMVDHIEPHGGDPVKFWDRSNWQPLCKDCHDSKSATYDGWLGNK